MIKNNISFSEANEEWLKDQIALKKYADKSALLNDMLDKAREQQVKIDWIKMKLERAEKSGRVKMSMEEVLRESKERFND